MKLTPLFDRVLILPIPEGKVSKGGLLIPQVAQASQVFKYGDVIAVGAGRTNAEGVTVPCIVKAGDVVCYPRKAGALIPITNTDGEEIPHVVLAERDILGTVEGLERPSTITGVDGRLLMMVPTSKGLPDSVYENRDGIEAAERGGFVEPGEFPPDEFEPGDGPVDAVTR